ncbi:hydrogenase maturation nickel metallochaperone HypA [Ectothiorhodospiraceae bacterium WFHF3C12]|nr:hydrogenase maturation nickel metallochaperone HypA [Ectothiorhodospiraceae bacterium WFHF3C12]
MHEMSLLSDLLGKIQRLAEENGAGRVVAVRVWLGALSHISAGHFREHFEAGVRGTLAEGAILEVETSEDMDDPHAQDILLKSIDVD